jgi:predicted hydrocarbon binding protein
LSKDHSGFSTSGSSVYTFNTNTLSARTRGSATAEFALTLPTLVIVLALVAAFLVGTVQSIRCQEAAREIARALAAQDVSDYEVIARTIAGSTAGLEITEEGEFVRVKVTAQIFHLPLGLIPPVIQGEVMTYSVG